MPELNGGSLASLSWVGAMIAAARLRQSPPFFPLPAKRRTAGNTFIRAVGAIGAIGLRKAMSFKRNVYLKTLPLPEAVAKVLDAPGPDHSAGRRPRARAGQNALPGPGGRGPGVVRGHAQHSSPTCHAAAMDGYAVRAADTLRRARASPCCCARAKAVSRSIPAIPCPRTATP